MLSEQKKIDQNKILLIEIEAKWTFGMYNLVHIDEKWFNLK